MHPSVITLVESARGCGYRSKGGIYLRFDGAAQACGRLPIPLVRCPCCGAGIRASRAPQWVDADMLLKPYLEQECPTPDNCATCPIHAAIHGNIGKSLLITVGEKFYPLPDDFIEESRRMGVSRRITSVPRDFEVGKTWVLFAHRKAVHERPEFVGPVKFTPGIFAMCQPTRIEYVVKGTETDEEIEALIKRGLTPVSVIRDIDTQLAFDLAEDVPEPVGEESGTA